MAETNAGAPKVAARDNDAAERSLGRLVALGLPAAGVAGAAVVGALAGLGSALLVLAAAALLGTIALLWASVRTLGGDAPLSTGFETIGVRRYGVDALAEQKRRVLRALKDLESEHALGKIEDGDYDTLVARYRDEAKSVMKEIDLQVAPLRAEAEKVADAFLAKKGLRGAAAASAGTPEPHAAPSSDPDLAKSAADDTRVACPKCSVSNEGDAAFCKKCGTPLGKTSEAGDAGA